MTASAYYQAISTKYEQCANPEQAAAMAAYMRNLFPFWGIPAPVRKTLLKELIKEKGSLNPAEWPALANLCFQQGTQREFQYLLGDLLVPQKKKLTADWLPLLEELITTLSWWDTVDWLAAHLVGTVLRENPDQVVPVTGRWIESDNIWLQRSALIFQLLAKEATDEDLLYQYVLRRADSTEFFVKKGAGWALRQYSKTNPESVSRFLASQTLPALTLREGRKVLDKNSLKG
jgi:3-methyladenine DNA glycosylase AlkD